MNSAAAHMNRNKMRNKKAMLDHAGCAMRHALAACKNKHLRNENVTCTYGASGSKAIIIESSKMVVMHFHLDDNIAQMC